MVSNEDRLSHCNNQPLGGNVGITPVQPEYPNAANTSNIDVIYAQSSSMVIEVQNVLSTHPMNQRIFIDGQSYVALVLDEKVVRAEISQVLEVLQTWLLMLLADEAYEAQESRILPTKKLSFDPNAESSFFRTTSLVGLFQPLFPDAKKEAVGSCIFLLQHKDGASFSYSLHWGIMEPSMLSNAMVLYRIPSAAFPKDMTRKNFSLAPTLTVRLSGTDEIPFAGIMKRDEKAKNTDYGKTLDLLKTRTPDTAVEANLIRVQNGDDTRVSVEIWLQSPAEGDMKIQTKGKRDETSYLLELKLSYYYSLGPGGPAAKFQPGPEFSRQFARSTGLIMSNGLLKVPVAHLLESRKPDNEWSRIKTARIVQHLIACVSGILEVHQEWDPADVVVYAISSVRYRCYVLTWKEETSYAVIHHHGVSFHSLFRFGIVSKELNDMITWLGNEPECFLDQDARELWLLFRVFCSVASDQPRLPSYPIDNNDPNLRIVTFASQFNHGMVREVIRTVRDYLLIDQNGELKKSNRRASELRDEPPHKRSERLAVLSSNEYGNVPGIFHLETEDSLMPLKPGDDKRPPNVRADTECSALVFAPFNTLADSEKRIGKEVCMLQGTRYTGFAEADRAMQFVLLELARNYFEGVEFSRLDLVVMRPIFASGNQIRPYVPVGLYVNVPEEAKREDVPNNDRVLIDTGITDWTVRLRGLSGYLVTDQDPVLVWYAGVPIAVMSDGMADRLAEDTSGTFAGCVTVERQRKQVCLTPDIYCVVRLMLHLIHRTQTPVPHSKSYVMLNCKFMGEYLLDSAGLARKLREMRDRLDAFASFDDQPLEGLQILVFGDVVWLSFPSLKHQLASFYPRGFEVTSISLVCKLIDQKRKTRYLRPLEAMQRMVTDHQRFELADDRLPYDDNSGEYRQVNAPKCFLYKKSCESTCKGIDVYEDCEYPFQRLRTVFRRSDEQSVVFRESGGEDCLVVSAYYARQTLIFETQLKFLASKIQGNRRFFKSGERVGKLWSQSHQYANDTYFHMPSSGYVLASVPGMPGWNQHRYAYLFLFVSEVGTGNKYLFREQKFVSTCVDFCHTACLLQRAGESSDWYCPIDFCVDVSSISDRGSSYLIRRLIQGECCHDVLTSGSLLHLPAHMMVARGKNLFRFNKLPYSKVSGAITDDHDRFYGRSQEESDDSGEDDDQKQTQTLRADVQSALTIMETCTPILSYTDSHYACASCGLRLPKKPMGGTCGSCESMMEEVPATPSTQWIMSGSSLSGDFHLLPAQRAACSIDVEADPTEFLNKLFGTELTSDRHAKTEMDTETLCSVHARTETPPGVVGDQQFEYLTFSAPTWKDAVSFLDVICTKTGILVPTADSIKHFIGDHHFPTNMMSCPQFSPYAIASTFAAATPAFPKLSLDALEVSVRFELKKSQSIFVAYKTCDEEYPVRDYLIPSLFVETVSDKDYPAFTVTFARVFKVGVLCSPMMRPIAKHKDRWEFSVGIFRAWDRGVLKRQWKSHGFDVFGL